jgi:3-oxoacyl-[acyl-carrier-protein] synthase II
MLAPSYSISRVVKHPELLRSLESASGYKRVPQTPLTVSGACAASLVAFTSIAAGMVLDYPGFQRPTIALWSAADAAVQPDLGVVEAFGPGAMMTRAKLAKLNEGRDPEQARSIADCLTPYDVDSAGTVVGNAGTAVIITTLDFALRNFLDITAVVVGWGQSGETGGKAHFAGVGFGGENALIQAFGMAHLGHGYGVEHFEYFGAHATGTHTNSKTELAALSSARRAAASRQGFRGALPALTIGATKALGDGHSMGETGLKAVSQAIQYLLGKPAVTLPTLMTPDPSLGAAADSFILRRDPVQGHADSGALCATQGFGGYDGAIALKAAKPESIARYAIDHRVLDAYLERWPQLRSEREQRERVARRRRGGALELAQAHCWRGLE